jgi:hypothetical protein
LNRKKSVGYFAIFGPMRIIAVFPIANINMRLAAPLKMQWPMIEWTLDVMRAIVI